MNRTDAALGYFSSGSNCNQAILLAFSDIIDIAPEKLVMLATGFGGGIGKTNNICGILSGAVMVLSYRYNTQGLNKDEVYERVSAFIEDVRHSFHATSCFDLLGCDTRTQDGKTFYETHHRRKDVCEALMRYTVQLLETYISL